MTRREFACPFPLEKYVIDVRRYLGDSRRPIDEKKPRKESRTWYVGNLSNPTSFSLSQPAVPVSSILLTFLHLEENVAMPMFDIVRLEIVYDYFHPNGNPWNLTLASPTYNRYGRRQ